MLNCSPNELLVAERNGAIARVPNDPPRSTAAGGSSIQRRHAGRVPPPL